MASSALAETPQQSFDQTPSNLGAAAAQDQVAVNDVISPNIDAPSIGSPVFTGNYTGEVAKQGQAAANDATIPPDLASPVSVTPSSAESEEGQIGEGAMSQSKLGTIAPLTINTTETPVQQVPITTLADQRVTPVSKKNIDGIKSPEVILNASLQKQIETLQAQIQALLQQLQAEKVNKEEAVLRATIGVQKQIEELRSLLKNQAEQIESDDALIAKLNTEIGSLKTTILNLETQLKEADTLIAGNSNIAFFVDKSPISQDNTTNIETETASIHPMISVLLSRAEMLQDSLRLAKAAVNDKAFSLASKALSGGSVSKMIDSRPEANEKTYGEVGSQELVQAPEATQTEAPLPKEEDVPVQETAQTNPSDTDAVRRIELEERPDAPSEGGVDNLLVSKAEVSLPEQIALNEVDKKNEIIPLTTVKAIQQSFGLTNTMQGVSASLSFPFELATFDQNTIPEILRLPLATGKFLEGSQNQALFETFKNTKTSDIYLSSGIFSGTQEERLALSAFIKELLVFFIPSHNANITEHEIAAILSNSTLEMLWNTCCTLYAEEVEKSKNSVASSTLERLNLHAGSEEEKLASLVDIRDLVYTNYLNALLREEVETPVVEALRKAFDMDGKEKLLNRDHSYDFFCIALKNFLLNKEQGPSLIALFEKVREETIVSLTDESGTKTPEHLV